MSLACPPGPHSVFNPTPEVISTPAQSRSVFSRPSPTLFALGPHSRRLSWLRSFTHYPVDERSLPGPTSSSVTLSAHSVCTLWRCHRSRLFLLVAPPSWFVPPRPSSSISRVCQPQVATLPSAQCSISAVSNSVIVVVEEASVTLEAYSEAGGGWSLTVRHFLAARPPYYLS